MRNKLEALKHTVAELKNGNMFHKWTHPESCNCGVVGQSVMGTNFSEYCHQLYGGAGGGLTKGLWSNSVYCSSTGAPLNDVVQKLFDAGFTRTEIIELENLSNKKIWREVGLFHLLVSHSRYKKENLIKYLEAWVRIIERETKPAEAEIRELPPPPMKFVKREEMKEQLIYAN